MWVFPQCVGAIDGSHIPIIVPKENPVDYFNKKRYHLVILQALVDHEYMFLDVYVGWPGSVHDVQVRFNPYSTVSQMSTVSLYFFFKPFSQHCLKL